MSDDANVPTIHIRCGCCRKFFAVPLGGSAYCADCRSGLHAPHCLAKELTRKIEGA